MIRRSASLLRFASSLPASSSPAALAAAESSSAWAARGAPAAAALQLSNLWQHHGGSSGAGAGPQQHMPVRHFSLWPGSGSSSSSSDKQQAGAEVLQHPDSLAAAGEDFGSSSSSFAAGSLGDGATSAAAAAGGVGAAPGVPDLFTASSIVAAAATAEGDVLAAAAEDSWVGTRLIQTLLTTAHDATGLPWWQSIMVTTLGMRLATLPIMIAQVKNTYRMSQARPEIEELVAHMKEEQARGNTDAAMQHQQRVMAVWKKYNCNPVKSLVGMFVQAPLFIGFFSALRGFAAHKLPSLTEGGALWFTDLTVADPTYALPVLAGLSFLATIELGAADGMEGQPEATRKRMKNAMRFVALIVPVVSTTLPASVFMYWTASNVFSLAQTTLLKIPAVKRAVGLPDLSKLKAPKQADLVGKPVPTYSQRPVRPVAAKKA